MTNIPENLKRIRIERGLKIQEVSAGSGIPIRTYQNYEYGERKISAEALDKLADFYGVTTDYLLGREPQSLNPILQLTQEEMERRLVAAYFSLPQKLRDEFLHSMAEELEKQGEIVETTTVGAELDRMAQSDAEAKDDAG